MLLSIDAGALKKRVREFRAEASASLVKFDACHYDAATMRTCWVPAVWTRSFRADVSETNLHAGISRRSVVQVRLSVGERQEHPADLVPPASSLPSFPFSSCSSGEVPQLVFQRHASLEGSKRGTITSE